MTINIVKLCVGVDTVEDLDRWQKSRQRLTKVETGQARSVSQNANGAETPRPKFSTAVRSIGSSAASFRCARQIIGFEDGQKTDGTKCCLIMLDPKLVMVRPTPRRAFQGWRYLEAGDAPPDLDSAGHWLRSQRCRPKCGANWLSSA